MRWTAVSFGSVEVDGKVYEHDLVLDRGRLTRRHKKVSKKYRNEFGHTPLSLEEELPWKCKRLIVGTGFEGGLPVMNKVREEAARRNVELLVLPTEEAAARLSRAGKETNAIIHVTC